MLTIRHDVRVEMPLWRFFLRLGDLSGYRLSGFIPISQLGAIQYKGGAVRRMVP